MRSEYAPLLCCPHCRGDLDLTILLEQHGDVIEGVLRCGPCARLYPITNGIPRMLPNSMLIAHEFRREHAATLADIGFQADAAEIGRFEKLHKKTARAFGFEWNTYQVTTPEEDIVTLAALTGFDREFYRKVAFSDIFTYMPSADDVKSIDTSSLAGRTVIEMGCGMGKYVKTVAANGARLAVGLDLSHSLERARENCRDLPNVLLVQGNILQPPFRPGAFDYVYSVGVLHHTPDCREAFRQSAALVKPGGRFSVWLYPTERRSGFYARAVHFVQDDVLRPITCRMPPHWLYQVCRLLGAMTFWRDHAAARGSTRLAQFLALFAVGAHSERKIAEFLNFDWYSPQYRTYHSEEELLRWFPEEGFGSVTILPMRTSGIAVKPAPDQSLAPHAAPGLRACLDYPNDQQRVQSDDDFLVQGWAFDVSGHSPVVEIFVNGRKVQELQCFAARVDVKQAFPDVPHALYCGFDCTLRTRRSWSQWTTIRMTVKSAACAPTVIAEREIQVTRRTMVREAAHRVRRWFPRTTARIVRRLRRETATQSPDKEAESARYRQWISLNETSAGHAHRCLGDDPLISLILPVHETPSAFLSELLASIAAQSCARWELCAVDDGSKSTTPWQILQEFAARHPHVLVRRRESAGGIAVASNEAIAIASGDYVAFIDHDDVLRADAIAVLSEAIRANPGVDVLYTDHDILEPNGERAEPRLKPGWSPDLLRSYMYWGHLKCMKTDLVRALGGLRSEFAGAEDYDLALRIAEKTDRIAHVPQVLYHWRRHAQSTSSGGRQKQYSIDSGIRALQQHLDRSGIAAEATWPAVCRNAGIGLFRLEFRFASFPRVAVVIPTRDRLELLARCISSLEEKTDYPAMEILVVDNGSIDPATLDYLTRTPHRVVRAPGPFNFSALVNTGAAATDAEYLLLLNNDTEIVQGDWLRRMVGWGRLPGVGAVGAKLLYPDGRIQHMGVVMGHEALTGHYFQGEPGAAGDLGYLSYKGAVRNVAAVTAACMLTPRQLFLDMGGFDEKRLQVAWNDVDYCLRLRQTGYRTVIDPDAVVVHHEGLSRGEGKNEREIGAMLERWQPIIEADPYYHPGFARTGRSFALRTEPVESEFPRLFYSRHWPVHAAGASNAETRGERTHHATAL